MVLLESEKKVRRRCWCGSKIQTATLPDGNTTTDFQNWRVSFGAAKPKRKRTKNLFGADYYFIEYRMPEAPFTVRVAIDRVDQVVRAYKEFATIPTKIQRRLILKVIPRDPDLDTPVFDHRPAKTAAKDKNKRLTLEQRYMSDEIDLLAYGDLRDPERKEKRLHDMAVYPLPERMYRASSARSPSPP
ncbi:hypothetical protein JL720_16681 [Aureococcus anophagefferens]|nr:hypothetical protein JL720_16681 [Aureococcus anophagefferens]